MEKLLLGAAMSLAVAASAAAADLELDNCHNIGPFVVCANAPQFQRPSALASLQARPTAKLGTAPIVHGHVTNHLATAKPRFTANMPMGANKQQAVHGLPLAE